MNTTELKALADREVELIEKAAQRAGMVSLMNHGAASCVYSEGCAGVTQEHLIAFAREIALHCATALYQPHLEDAQGEIRALRATEQNLREKAERWDFIASRMLAADFDYGGEGVQALVFEMPDGFSASSDAADTIDRARALLEDKT